MLRIYPSKLGPLGKRQNPNEITALYSVPWQVITSASEGTAKLQYMGETPLWDQPMGFLGQCSPCSIPLLTARSVFLSCSPSDLSSSAWFSELSFGTAEPARHQSLHLLFSINHHGLILPPRQAPEMCAHCNTLLPVAPL